MELVAVIRDDAEPTPGNIASVDILWRVDGKAWRSSPMRYDEVTGVRWRFGSSDDPDRPFSAVDRRTFWLGKIPGQPSGSRVEFRLRVEDARGLSGHHPAPLCPEGTGPCDPLYGGPGCEPDPESRFDCDAFDADDDDSEAVGEGFLPCKKPLTYVSGYTPPPGVESIVINEIVPNQEGLLRDRTELPCSPSDCPPHLEDSCCQMRDDFVELVNTSDEPVDLSGCWIGDSYFVPWGWQFPEGTLIPPGERFIVWCDDDAGRCPDPDRRNPPCFWACPDPNVVHTTHGEIEFHTNFALDLDGDQVFLFDREDKGYGIIDGFSFDQRGEPVPLNASWSRVPDGDRDGTWVLTRSPTPGEPNPVRPVHPLFRRGDATDDGTVNLSDAVFVLNWLFLAVDEPGCLDAADSNDSGNIDISDGVHLLNWLFREDEAPPPPGPFEAGRDPTDDRLTECEYATP